MQTLPHKTLGSGYRNLTALTTALYGTICKAETLEGEEVAIKRLDMAACRARQTVPALGLRRKSVAVREDAMLEIQLMKRLSGLGGAPGQAHVMPLHDAFVDETQKLCMVLPLCKKGDLFAQLEANGAFGQRRARKLFLQLLHGLHFLHGQGIAHRDLSLENLLLRAGDGGEDHLLIADLGLAAEIDERKGNACKGRVGKNFYISPEAFHGSAGDTGLAAGCYDGKATDMWSAGVILFMMLSGVPPHDRPCTSDPRFVYTMEGRIGAMLRCWGMLEQFGGGALELVQALMCVEPGARMKLSEVMAHPWVVGDGTDLPWEAVTARAVPCAEVLPAGEEGEEEDEVQEEVQEEATATASGLPMSSEPAAETSPDLECEPSPPPRETDSDLAGAVLFALDNISIKPFQL